MSIAVVHLVWAPLGPEPLRTFLRSYRAHPAGAAHELVVLLNGLHGNATGEGKGAADGEGGGEGGLTHAQALAELGDTPCRTIALERPLVDLAAYGYAATQLEHEWLCFLNSYSVILADGWLGHLASAAAQPGVGIAGASGSWESQAQWIRGRPGDWPLQLRRLRAAREDYPRFPNPHIRTTAFMLRRRAVLELGLAAATDKRAAYLLESGHESITRRIRARGERAVLVGRDGGVYDVERWPASATYRAGGQENLLVADNRTEDWRRAGRVLRRRLSRDAWGEPHPKVNPAATPLSADPQAPADAAIVIVNYRTPELTERCLRSVYADAPDLRLEATIVDNDSRDGSAERLRACLPSARVVAMSRNGGFGAGVNAGFQNSAAELVVVLNPDTEVRPGALRALLEHLRAHPRTGVVAPLIEDDAGRIATNGYRRFPGLGTLALELCVPFAYALVRTPGLHPYSLAPAALCAGARPAHVSGAAMAIRRSAYTDAGPFDERFFMYLEETEWQRRVAQRGWAIEVAPAARVRHLVRGGGEEALAPSPHFLDGALCYLSLRHVPRPLARGVLALALASSWATVRLIALAPAKRHTATRQARAYRALLGRALRWRSDERSPA